MTKGPLVSVISPCYNGENYVCTFLESVLSQQYDNLELIFVDDGSTDATSQIVKSYRDRFADRGYHLEYIYQDNSGQASAINTGLKKIRGEYLMWMDSDDIMLPNNISVKLECLRHNPDVDFVLGQEELVDCSDLDKPLRITKRVIDGAEDNLFQDMVSGHNVVFGPGTILVRAASFFKAVPTGEIFASREGQNWQLMLPLIYMCRWAYVDEVVIKCVRYPNSHSRMERNDLQRLHRNDGVRELLCETIKRIPTMSDQEKQSWIAYISEKYLRGSLYVSYDMGDLGLLRKYKQELKERGLYSFKASHLWYGVYKLSRKIR